MQYKKGKGIIDRHNIKFTCSLPKSINFENMSDVFFEMHNDYKNYIHDINVTSRVGPFQRDAHGINLPPQAARRHMMDAIKLQEKTGITVSFLFNNIYVPPTEENLDLFISQFKEWYDRGVRSITIPHLLWMASGKLQREFPELYIKDTVLREVDSARQFWNHAKLGFNYINIDRRVMRDFKTLKEIKKAKDKFYELYGEDKKLSMLTSEGCVGNCPYFVEHYQHTMQHLNLENNNNEIFQIPQNKYMGCHTIKQNPFKAVDLPLFVDHLDEIFECIDIIKIAGRRHGGSESYSCSIDGIISFNKLKVIEINNDFVVKNNLVQLILDDETNRVFPSKQLWFEWKAKIRNCKWNCWNCSLCDDLNCLKHR